MHPSSSSSSSSSSFSDFHEVPFLTTYKVTLPRMTNINKTNTMVQKKGEEEEEEQGMMGLEKPDETSTAKKKQK